METEGIAELPKVTIIVVNFNGLPYVDDCVASVLRTNYSHFDLVLVDNDSKDGSLDHVLNSFGYDQKLRVLANNRNLGYAKANNMGAAIASSKYLVFLNPDTVVRPNWLKPLVDIFETTNDVAATQSKLLLARDRRTLDSCGHMLTQLGLTVDVGAGELDSGQFDRVFSIFSAKGAAFAVRNQVFKKVGGFDPDFFLLREESDLCWRMWLVGYRVLFVPESVVFHVGGATFRELGEERKRKVIWPLWYRNTMYMIIKNAEFKTLACMLSSFLTLSLGDGLATLVLQGNPDKLTSIILALCEVITRFKHLWASRTHVQLLRRKSDRDLSSHIIWRISPSYKLSLRRRNTSFRQIF